MKKIMYRLKDQYGIVHKLDLNSYDDRMSASPEQSLFIVGLLRQSKTNKVIFWNDEGFKSGLKNVEKNGYIEISYIGIEDVRTALKSVDKDFYISLGSTRQEVLGLLPKNKGYLTGIIFSLNNWNGWFYK